MRTVSRLSPKHRAAVAGATARLNIWHGSVRSGKTVSANIRWLRFIREAPPGTLAMVGKTTTTLRHNVLGPIYDMLGPSRMRVWSSKGEAEILGRFVRILGANDERAEAKIRGDTFAGAYGDELTLWPKNLFGMLLSRLSVRGAKFFGSTNPDNPNHWLKADWIDRESTLDLKSFHFKLRDNPYLDADFIAALEAEYTGLWHKRFVDGLWVVAEGAVWDGFDSRHVIDELPAGVDIVEMWGACDYGTTNPFVALLFGMGSDGVTYVLDEYRWDSHKKQRQMTDPEYSKAVGEWLGGRTLTAFYPDPSAASFILQLRRDHPDLAVKNADHDVLDGIRFVAKMLGNDTLRVMRGCSGLTGEIEGYVWDEKAAARGEDKPVKQADHGPDTLRYGCYSHLARRVDLSQFGWVA